jgi:enediyne biosynthesis protein E4
LTDVNNWPAIGNRTWSGYQKKRLFHNRHDGTFAEVSAQAGVDNDMDGRGIAVGDFDNDGRLDLVQANADQPLLLYHNITEKKTNWVEFRLIGVKSNRDAIGARVRIRTGNANQIREVDGGNGYAGQSTKRIHFGLGAATKIDRLDVLWPSGRKEIFSVPINQIITLKEGEGTSVQ